MHTRYKYHILKLGEKMAGGKMAGGKQPISGRKWRGENSGEKTAGGKRLGEKWL